MVAHEKRNSAQLFCAVPTRNDLALSSLLFPAQPTQKLEYPGRPEGRNCKQMIKNRPPVHRQAIQTGKWKKASQSLRPQTQRKPDHFLRRHVRRRKYRSARKRALQRAAISANKDPAKRSSLGRAHQILSGYLPAARSARSAATTSGRSS